MESLAEEFNGDFSGEFKGEFSGIIYLRLSAVAVIPKGCQPFELLRSVL